jgi:uncharacterized membrane protein
MGIVLAAFGFFMLLTASDEPPTSYYILTVLCLLAAAACLTRGRAAGFLGSMVGLVIILMGLQGLSLFGGHDAFSVESFKKSFLSIVIGAICIYKTRFGLGCQYAKTKDEFYDETQNPQ